MNELKSCPICGASELKLTGTEEHDGQAFGLYKCPACDTSLSAYERYLKTLKAAKNNVSAAQESSKEPTDSINKNIPVNTASVVYQKNITGTIALVSQMEDGILCGTGTVIGDNGYFITNAHVVMETDEDDDDLLNMSEEVYGQSGEHHYRFTAELIFADPSMDLALLKTEPNTSMTSISLADQEAIPGEPVYVIGNSKGEGLCIVEGIVSDVHRKVGSIDAIMISAPVTTGNSGGPVFNAEGKLLGVIKSGHSDINSMNYVIPVKTIRDFLHVAQEQEDIEL